MQIVRGNDELKLDQEHLATLNDRLKVADEELESGVSLFKEGKLADTRQEWLDNNPTFDLTADLEKAGGSLITQSFEKTLAEFKDPKTEPRRRILLGGFITSAIDAAKKKTRKSTPIRRVSINNY